MTGSFQVGRFFGIPVNVHATWLVVYFLVTWSLAARLLPASYPDWQPTALYWAAGAIGALLLFVSVLVHEFSHALVARMRGLRVGSITLFIFGGVALIEDESETPFDEFLIAVVGPITSLVLAALAWTLAIQLGAESPLVGGGVGAAIVSYVALANGLLAFFNLIPGFPLDGGRILRAILWGASGSLRKATNWASYVGQAVGFGLIGVGVLQIFNGEIVGGLWIAFIGWFLNNAAETSRQESAARETMQGVRVADLMTREPATVGPEMPLDVFVYEQVISRGHRALPVLRDGQLVGVVSITDVRHTPAPAWPTTMVGAVMTSDGLATATPEDEVKDALKLMTDRGLNQILVLRDGHLAGLLTRAAIVQYLTLRDELDLPPRRRGTRVGPRP